MSKELETCYAKVLKSRYITPGIRCDLQKIDRLYSTLARLKFEIYNVRKEADVEYTAVCGVVTCKDEKNKGGSGGKREMYRTGVSGHKEKC